MYPRVFLETFWRMELRPQVFVAMSFDPKYQKRFEDVIDPAIRSISIENTKLEPFRVDLSKSGDSILTEIMDGIAHCQLFLADVSTVGTDKATGFNYRNGNVMYEVGLALACRQSCEVLLVRDDTDKFLFDVSAVPHMNVDFTNPNLSIPRLQLVNALVERLNERRLLDDARIKMVLASLSTQEIGIIRVFLKYTAKDIFYITSRASMAEIVGMPRLLDKHIIRSVSAMEDGNAAYQWTPLGVAVAQRVASMPLLALPKKEEVVPPDEEASEI